LWILFVFGKKKKKKKRENSSQVMSGTTVVLKKKKSKKRSTNTTTKDAASDDNNAESTDPAVPRLALHRAVVARDIDRVRSLLSNMSVADVNALDDSGNAALHLAVYLNEPRIVELLLDKGARGAMRNSRRWSPLAIVAGDWFD
jgi:ankyrin repeat protein